jgi:hypothetical protein
MGYESRPDKHRSRLQADGCKFITMEYLEGQDLRVVLREKGKLTPEADA